jgi:hypothetical protein
VRRLDRLADNERRIREANEEAELVARDAAGRATQRESPEVEFYCACGREHCDDTILLTVAEYEAIHRLPHRFVVVPGHETEAVERVVERHPGYLVVEKRPRYQRDVE